MARQRSRANAARKVKRVATTTPETVAATGADPEASGLAAWFGIGDGEAETGTGTGGRANEPDARPGAGIGAAPAALLAIDVPQDIPREGVHGPAGDASQPAAMTLAPDHFAALAGTVVKAAGNMVCDKARVTRLADGEVAALAGALSQLASAYNLLGQLDPKVAAWLSLGLVFATVAANREKLPPVEDAPAEQVAA